MKQLVVSWRNSIIHFFYTKALKPFYFKLDPELVHDRMTMLGNLLGKFVLTRGLTHLAFNYSHKKLEQEILGIKFKNPIGLAAGFDKDAQLTQILPSVGFGFEEIGSVTGYPCQGNPKPRLWRLPKSKSLVVYYGLKNPGADKVYQKLQREKFNFILGVSVAMTNCQDNLDNQKAIADYVKAFSTLVDIGHYMTVNISCPNALKGQPFLEPEPLDQLLTAIDAVPCDKPIFLKLSPDMNRDQTDDVLKVIKTHRVQGLIISNLTKPRTNSKIHLDDKVPDKGGISGKVVEDLSNDLLKYIYQKEGEHFTLIGCGGVFTAEDAYKKIKLGASLIQLITGMIFEGPQAISAINQGLVKLLEKDGYKNISEAVGVEARS